MEFKVIRITFDDGTEQIFNFQYVRDFSYNEENKSVIITIKDDGSSWDTQTFINVTEVHILNLE